MTNRDEEEFRGYLRNCTDAQVQGVWEKEVRANRKAYAELAKDEGYRRNIHIG
jgi:hypothetical protein